MFGLVRKSKVLKLIEEGQKQLRDKENYIILNTPIPKDMEEREEFLESINKLRGGRYFLECLKKHFK